MHVAHQKECTRKLLEAFYDRGGLGRFNGELDSNMQGEDNRVVRKRTDIFPEEIFRKAYGRRVSAQDVDNPPRENSFTHEQIKFSTLEILRLQRPKNDHDVILEMEDKQFTRMEIVFREGKQVFKSYAQRGLCLDGTFLKI
uniref:AlNc14C176G8143 protein n=1 Tax=Albugo laibachii Nc14 TaxID=890382 RepID=F0WNY8_9STRA|nr:AlNc14C176G8143 [Albugo laibachii Nc14]|eukprot:CCA23031.1 AlNc14C176G8143 [Albugo laibachii Nc14]